MLQTKSGLLFQLQSLLQVAAHLSQVKLEAVEALSEVLLAMPPENQGLERSKSGLNSDGSPLQFCLTSTEKGLRGRLLGDPASVIADPRARFEASQQALDQVLELTHSRPLAPLYDRTLSFYVPTEPEGFAHFTSGVLWLGAGLDTPGCAMYVDGRCKGQPQDPWDRAQDWLTAILPHSDAACDAIAALRRYGQLNSIGIEGSKPTNARAKLYWRLQRPVCLEDMGLEILHDPGFATFLVTAIQDKRIQLSGLVFSLGFLLATGEVFDAKIDVCGHCLDYSARGWVELLDHLAQSYGLTKIPIGEVLYRDRSQVSYLGLGLDQQGTPRLNLYLKAIPPLSSCVSH